MFLVDWGEVTLIPQKLIYRMPHRFMIDYQMSLFTSVVLEGKRLNKIVFFANILEIMTTTSFYLFLFFDFELLVWFNLTDIVQYDYDSSDNDDKWKYLLLPGMKIKVKVVWMYDEMNIIRLIYPSEKQVRIICIWLTKLLSTTFIFYITLNHHSWNINLIFELKLNELYFLTNYKLIFLLLFSVWPALSETSSTRGDRKTKETLR